jgi:hypothetical protein
MEENGSLLLMSSGNHSFIQSEGGDEARRKHVEYFD